MREAHVSKRRVGCGGFGFVILRCAVVPVDVLRHIRHSALTLTILLISTVLLQAQTASRADAAAGAVGSGKTAGAPKLGIEVVPGGLLAASVAAAADVTQSDTVARGVNRSVYDKIWQFAKWYENDSNPIVQQVLFSGRYQHEYNALKADQGDNGEVNVRRMRFGPKVTLFRNWLVHGEVEVNPQEADPFYLRVTDLYVTWTKSPAFEVTVGKHGVAFTMDGSTSSKELLSIDRSNLSNNIWFPQEYIPGVSVSGEIDAWRYYSGVYSGGTANREFGEFDAGVFTLAAVGYDFGEALAVKEALLMGNYVYQQEDPGNTFTRQLEHVGSVNFKFEAERWGVRGDLSYASGYLGQSDLFGLMAMPFVNLTDKLQAIGRYTLITSDLANGVRLATYEKRVVSGRGDRYREGYLGLNYFLYGHKLKLQSGLQVADLRDRANHGAEYVGVSWTNGLRVSW